MAWRLARIFSSSAERGGWSIEAQYFLNSAIRSCRPVSFGRAAYASQSRAVPFFPRPESLGDFRLVSCQKRGAGHRESVAKPVVCRFAVFRLSQLLAPLQDLEQELLVFPAALAEQDRKVFHGRGVDRKVTVEPVGRADGFHQLLAEERVLGQPVAHAGARTDRHGGLS